MALINCPECGNSISDQASHCPKCGYQISNHSFFPKTEGCFLQSMNMGCLILVIIFLFSIILSEYDIPPNNRYNYDYCIWNNDMLQFFQKEKTKSMIIFKNAINL